MHIPRTGKIRVAKFVVEALDIQVFNVGPTGDYATRAGLFDDGELFVDVHKNGEPLFHRIIFDHATTGKIRLLLRRQEQ